MENSIGRLVDYPIAIIFIACILLLVVAVILALAHGKKTFIKRKLSLLAIDVIENAECLDAVDDIFHIDFLLLQPDKVIACTVLPFEGLIFASKDIEQWTQVLKTGSYKFSNPYQNFAMQEDALQRMFPELQIESRLFFPKASFPKDKPNAVMTMDDIPAIRKYKPVEIQHMPKKVSEIWQQIKKGS